MGSRKAGLRAAAWTAGCLASAVGLGGLVGCGQSGVGGGVGIGGVVASGGIIGTACNPSAQSQGCRIDGGIWTRVACDPGTSLWKPIDTCAPGQSCIEGLQGGAKTATCVSFGGADTAVGTDTATGQDGSAPDAGGQDVAKDAGEPQDITVVSEDTGVAAADAKDSKDSKDTKDTSDVQIVGECVPGEKSVSDSGVEYSYSLQSGLSVLQGPYTRTKNGVVVIEGCLQDNGRVGTWTFRYDSGKPEGEEFFDATHKLSGPFVGWFENGQTSYEGTALDGKIEGPYAEWYESGAKAEVSTYKNGLPFGKTTTWFENGQKSLEGAYTAAGLPTGTFTWWHDDGSVAGTSVFSNGNGTMSLTYVSGNQWISGKYVSGKRNGAWTTWYDSGNKARVSQLSMGSGSVTEYWDVAGLKKAVTYSLVDERKNGLYTQYDKDGATVVLTGPMVDNAQEGTWTSTDAAGADTFVCWFDNLALHVGACTDQDPAP